MRAAWLAGMVLFLFPGELLADDYNGTASSNVVCREELSNARREELTAKLRKITGLAELTFDRDGFLRLPDKTTIGDSTIVGGRKIAGGSAIAGGSEMAGSESARALLASAVNGHSVVVIEDASGRSDIVFCRVVPGKWTKTAADKPPVFVAQIDFADFDQIVGDERALEAFNVGWGLLHELDHVVSDSPDASALGETGECEAHINQMRRECNLPERADYFFTVSPLAANTTFMTRLVRLAFEEPARASNKKKRYWLTWDANVVGGLEQSQVAALR
jgi:hypothetical protein